MPEKQLLTSEVRAEAAGSTATGERSATESARDAIRGWWSETGNTADRMRVNFNWLVKLRWVACLGQLVVISVVMWAFGIPLPFAPLVTVITITALTNVGLVGWFVWISQRADWGQATIRTAETLLLLIMGLDLVLLSTLLYWTGGPNNPFCLFFFVNLSLAGVLLSRATAIAFHFFSAVCFGGLMYVHQPLDILTTAGGLPPIYTEGSGDIRHFGMFVAFLTCSSVIVYFMTRLTGELRQQEIDLRTAQTQRSKSEKYEALGTLAAGAAHELSTPLSTIAVVVKEAESMGRSNQLPEELTEDLALIRSEVDRCRRILNRMAVGAGQVIGEAFSDVTPDRLLKDVLAELQKVIQEPVQMDLDAASASEFVQVPPIALAQALRALVKNAIDAVPGQGPIVLTSRLNEEWVLEIRDQGPGMPREILERVSEPFFTTKSPGNGMGLGVFLARSVIERLGGRLQIESRDRRGTRVTVLLPRRQRQS
jgi:two-component system sensor histidine kinase RegB